MSIACHHAEWLSLTPTAGPFLSLPVLVEVFPAGLEAHDPEHGRRLRQAYADWRAACDRRRPDPAAHDRWVRFVLTETLGFRDGLAATGQAIPQTLQTRVPEQGEWLRPDWVMRDPATGQTRLLVQVYPPPKT
ncbi:MAG: hypothetical protein RML57_06790 [Acidobacteriota bacterium]|nr:hypothetical protein [Acidobacteriota bacterium]